MLQQNNGTVDVAKTFAAEKRRFEIASHVQSTQWYLFQSKGSMRVG